MIRSWVNHVLDGSSQGPAHRIWNIVRDQTGTVGLQPFSVMFRHVVEEFSKIHSDVLPDPGRSAAGWAETETYTEDGSVFSTGTGTAEYQGQKIKQPLTFEVVEREGGWFIIRNVNPNDDESCFDTAAR